MKKLLKNPKLIERDVPAELDNRIMLQAALAATRRRSSRRWKFFGAFGGMAAAAAVAAVVWLPAAPDGSAYKTELLELSDWTTLEQEAFNLSSQLNCGWQEFPDIRNS